MIKNKECKTLIFKVMKQKFFTLIVMFALVIVAGSAFGQNNNNRVAPEDSVYTSSTGSYSLGGIEVNQTGTLTIDFTGADATIQNVGGVAGAYAGGDIAVPSGSPFTLTFDIVFGAVATDGVITVEVTDGATNGCTNQITLGITVFPEPTIDIALTMPTGADSLFCQTTNGILNNIAASVNSRDSIEFTVTPTIENDPATFTFGYSLSVTGAGLTGLTLVKISGPGTFDGSAVTGANAETAAIFRARWTTTTGLAQIPLIATAGTASLIDTSDGGAGAADPYAETETGDNTDRIQVKSTPSIGTFQ